MGTIEDIGRRFVDAWHRLERGERVQKEHVTLASLDALLSTLTPERLELLRDVRREPAASVKALAEHPGRDHERVHEDVEALSAAGLLVRVDRGITAPFGEIRAELDRRAVA